MLSRSTTVLVVAAAGVAIAASALAAQEPQRAPKPQPKPAAAQPDEASPRIVVHKDAAAKDAADCRVKVGEMRISMSNWSPNRPADDTQTAGKPDHAVVHPHSHAPAAPVRADGAVVIPDNTLGPGEPLWSIREREDAARKVAQAEADLARAEAERPHAHSRWSNTTAYGWFNGWNSWDGRYGSWRTGLRGPVTTTIIRDDSLGSTARRAYSDAAYPPVSPAQEARDRAVRQFGKDATPPINRTQEDIDRAHRNANREQRKE